MLGRTSRRSGGPRDTRSTRRPRRPAATAPLRRRRPEPGTAPSGLARPARTRAPCLRAAADRPARQVAKVVQSGLRFVLDLPEHLLRLGGVARDELPGEA